MSREVVESTRFKKSYKRISRAGSLNVKVYKGIV